MLQDAEARLERLERQIMELLPAWSCLSSGRRSRTRGAPVVEAVQAMRGVALILGLSPKTAVTVVAEVGDFSRFASPRQLMAYLAWSHRNGPAA